MKFPNKLLLTLFAGLLFAQEGAQTPAQIQEQKDLANLPVIESAAENFRTPLKAFEKFYAGISSSDASEFSCLTQNAIRALLDVEELTSEGIQRIRNANLQRDEKEHEIIEFLYSPDVNRPKIVFSYRYNYRDNNGQRLTTTERQRLTFLRTLDGWRIDLLESNPR